MGVINSINNKSRSLRVISPSGGSGDSYVQFSLDGSVRYTIGAEDDGSSGNFKIGVGSDLTTTTVVDITTLGSVSMPLQPAFLGVLNADRLNVTGASVTYKVVWDTTVYDQNSDFDGTEFTAPVDGTYRFDVHITFADLGTSNTNGYIQLVTSNRNFLAAQLDYGDCKSVNDELGVGYSFMCDMDANDVAYVNVNINSGTQIVDLVGSGSTTPECWFSGYLAS